MRLKAISRRRPRLGAMSPRPPARADPNRIAPNCPQTNDAKKHLGDVRLSGPTWAPFFLSSLLLGLLSTSCLAQYRPNWPSPYVQREIFVLNLEDGYFGCQVNESTDFLQLFELSKLCDGVPQCFQGSDEVSLELKCKDRSKSVEQLCQISLTVSTSSYRQMPSQNAQVHQWSLPR